MTTTTEPATPASPPTIGARLELYETLTARERAVAQLLAMGLSCREISAQLAMGQKTAECHRGRALEKLGLKNVAELARDAIRVGFVPPPDETTP